MDCKQAILELLRETFQGMRGQGTWYSDSEPNAGLFGTLASISAEQASARTCGKSTIAGHAIHTAYYMSAAIAEFTGQDFNADWGSSWAEQQVNEQRWAQVQDDLRLKYDALKDAFHNLDGWKDEETLTYAIANVAHAAFHLGAIRQLVPVHLD